MVEASGLEARVLQHEIDHLDGVLMLDRDRPGAAQGGARALREGASYSPSAEESEDADPTAAATSLRTRVPGDVRVRRRRCFGASRTRPTGPPSWSPRLTGLGEGGAGWHRHRSRRRLGELGLELLQTESVNRPDAVDSGARRGA